MSCKDERLAMGSDPDCAYADCNQLSHREMQWPSPMYGRVQCVKGMCFISLHMVKGWAVNPKCIKTNN